MVSFFLTFLRLGRALWKVIREPLFQSLFVTLSLILLSGTIFFMTVEGWAVFDAFYFSFTSLMPTSMDIGLTPASTMGKVFTMAYLTVGLGVMFAMLLLIGKAVVNFSGGKKDE